MFRRRAPEGGPGGGGDALSVRDRSRGALDVGDGELVALLGASGQGKTAWLRSLLGFGEPFSSVRAFGADLGRERIPQVLSWVPDNGGVFLSETVLANVVAPGQALAVPAAHAMDALDLVGLASRARDPVADLGAGERRRVALARAVARRRPILVVDGPLDPAVWDLWPDLAAGMTWLRATLVASAVADGVVRRADSVALLAGGVVVAQAPLRALEASRDPAVREVLAWVTPG